MNNIDVITYEIGDVVIRKNKEKDMYGKPAVPETIVNTRIVEAETYYYQLLYFESDPNSGNVALEYEPVNSDLKESYYFYLKTIKEERSKRRTKTKVVDNTITNEKETIKVNPHNAKTTFIPKL
jgi:hypothetical protein